MKVQKWLPTAAFFSILQLGSVLPAFASGYTASDIALTPGKDASELNFAWILDDLTKGSCAVQVVLEGGSFEKSATFTGIKNKSATGNALNDKTDYSYCSVTVSGLKDLQAYSYHLGDNEGKWSETYQYSTEDSKKYGFVYLADAQIGASMGRRPTPEKIAQAAVDDTQKWVKNLSTIIDNFPHSAFIMSAGDQIEVPGDEAQWSGFFAPSELTSIPLAPTPAAHDELGSGRGGIVTSYAFDYHFNLPNESVHSMLSGDINECPPPGAPRPPGAKKCIPEYKDSEAAAGDYYFSYGDALYIVLNMDSENYEEHDDFIQSAVAANPNAKWRMAMWHYTIYTAANRHPFVDRDIMGTMMEKNSIDLVLQGHDHTYCRTYPMLNGVVQKDVFNEEGASVNPTGVVYMTANSSSGSKYYTLNPDANTLSYAAAFNQENVPTFSYVDVDASNLTITTYKTGSMEVIDKYSISKTAIK